MREGATTNPMITHSVSTLECVVPTLLVSVEQSLSTQLHPRSVTQRDIYHRKDPQVSSLELLPLRFPGLQMKCHPNTPLILFGLRPTVPTSSPTIIFGSVIDNCTGSPAEDVRSSERGIWTRFPYLTKTYQLLRVLDWGVQT